MFLFGGQSRPLAVWHSQVRWIRGLEMEADFWRGKLSLNPEENVSLERVSDWVAIYGGETLGNSRLSVESWRRFNRKIIEQNGWQ